MPSDRARALSRERRRDGADVTMRWDLRRRNWFCGMPRSFRTTQTCLSEHLDHPPMPTGGPMTRQCRGEFIGANSSAPLQPPLPGRSVKSILNPLSGTTDPPPAVASDFVSQLAFRPLLSRRNFPGEASRVSRTHCQIPRVLRRPLRAALLSATPISVPTTTKHARFTVWHAIVS